MPVISRFFSKHMTSCKTLRRVERFCSIRRLGPERVCGRLPENVQRRLIEQRAKFFVIDGNKVARDAGMGGRINTVMQTCFFAISGVLPAQQAIEAIKNSIRKTYGEERR